MAEEDPSLQGGSPTIKMFKGSITFAILLASPLILMGIVSIVGSAFHMTGATLGLMGVLTMVIGFCGILIYYYQTASALLGKTTLNKLHWETPSNDIGYSAVIEEQVYLGKIKGTDLHHIFYKFEGDIPNELMITPCLSEGSGITTLEGKKKVEDVKCGEQALTHNGRFEKITKTYVRPYNGKLIQLSPYYTQPINLTPDHPVLGIKTMRCSLDKRCICLPSCSRYDKCKKKIAKFEPTWILAKELDKGDIVVTPILQKNNSAPQEINPSYKRNTRNSPQIKIQISPEFLELVGLYLAEGSIGYGRSRSTISNIRLSFGCHEKELINHTCTLIEKCFGIEPKKYTYRKEKGTEVLILNAPLARYFKETFGVKEDKHLPIKYLTIPSETQKYIVKGYLEGDGCAGYGHKNMSVGSVSFDLLENIKTILLRMGIMCSIQKTKPAGFSKRDEIHYLAISSSTKNEIKKFFLDRYKEVIKKQKRRPLGWIDNKYMYCQIKDVRAIPYEGKVFNFEIENDNSYVSGITLHNCHPNEIIGQPRRDWIPYKNLIYPASVASVDTVELRKSDLGLDEDSGYVVSYPIASSWHATQVQQDAGRLLTGEKLLANPHPTEDIVNKAIKSLEASETVLTKERLIQSERQKEAYKQIVKAGKTRLADTYADIAELETEAKKKPPAVMGEGWTQGSRLRKVAIVGVVGLASIIAGVITYFVIVG